MRGFDAPTDRVKGYGLDQPNLQGGGNAHSQVSFASGFARIKVSNMQGTRTHRIDFMNRPRGKYLFALVQANSGVIGFRSTTGQRTWASHFDAYEVNNGMICCIEGKDAIDGPYFVDHHEVTALGWESNSASGDIYLWFADKPEMPLELRNTAPAAEVGD